MEVENIIDTITVEPYWFENEVDVKLIYRGSRYNRRFVGYEAGDEDWNRYLEAIDDSNIPVINEIPMIDRYEEPLVDLDGIIWIVLDDSKHEKELTIPISLKYLRCVIVDIIKMLEDQQSSDDD